MTGPIPDNFINARNLQQFIAPYNSFESFPKSFAGMTQLVHLEFTENTLRGGVPPEFSTLINMQNFKVQGDFGTKR